MAASNSISPKHDVLGIGKIPFVAIYNVDAQYNNGYARAYNCIDLELKVVWPPLPAEKMQDIPVVQVWRWWDPMHEVPVIV